MLIQKLFGWFAFYWCVAFCFCACGKVACVSSGTAFCCFVVGTSTGVAWFATGYEIFWKVVSSSVVLDQVVCLGGLAFLAPVAPGFVG
jgi:hypothetical protein